MFKNGHLLIFGVVFISCALISIGLPLFFPAQFQLQISDNGIFISSHMLFVSSVCAGVSALAAVSVLALKIASGKDPVQVEVLETNPIERVIRRLRERESHLKAVLDGTKDAIIGIDEKGMITDFNRAAEKIFGYSSQQAKGRNIALIIPDEEKQNHRNYMQQGPAATKKILGGSRQLYGKHKNGSLIAIEITISRISGSSKTKYVGVIRDVSELLQERNNLLEALDEARAANETKNRILSSVSHELRTPLNAIVGFSELLSTGHEHYKVGQLRQYVEDINRSASLLLLLVNDVLDYARLESGTLTVDIRKVELSGLISTCLRIHEIEFSKRLINCVLNCKSEVWVKADEMRLKQVLLNLLSNACKYNKRGGSVEIAVSQQGQNQVVVEVKDSGIGIVPEKAKLLFIPFARLHNLRLDIEGSGLGLSICKEIIELMGGRIAYRPNPVGGSIFQITLPCVAVDKEEYSFLSSIDLGFATFPGLKVLYVEDNKVNIRLMQAIMRRLSVDLFSVETAEEGLEYIKKNKPDVIFMDINLPGISGYQAVEKILAMPEMKMIPVVAVSAAIDSDENKSRQLFTAWIDKPFKIKQIAVVIDKVINRS